MWMRSERTDNVNFLFCFLPLFKNREIIVYISLEGQGFGSMTGTRESGSGGRGDLKGGRRKLTLSFGR